MDQLGFSLYLITDRAAAPRPPADVVEECLAAGLRAVQLREKDLEARELLALADTLREATGRHGARLIVNDRADVALVAAADGVQRTHASLPVSALREITPRGFLVGASVHSEAEARQAAMDGADFIVFGPVYDTASKRRYGPPQGLANLETVARSVDRPVLAVGGLTPERVPEVLAAGAAGVAVIGAIYAAARPADATKAFLDALGESVMAAPSVAVIGGGIIGCATAADLAKRGCRVTLFERAGPGAEASSAAAGLLAPLGPVPEPGPFHRLAIESWRLYPTVASELRELTGVDVEHMTAGTLYPLHSPREIAEARLRQTWPLAKEFGVEVVEGGDLRALEPALSKDVSAARFVRGDHWVNNQRLVTAYAAAAAARGVTVRTGAEVSRILIEGGRARGVLVDGEAVHADAVLLAAGAWSGALATSIGLRLPVAPVRGQMLAVSNLPPLITRALHRDDIYVVPRPSGEILIGATVEHAGFLREVTPDGLASLITAAVALVPEIGRRSITRSWCGFRPWVPDGQPVLGPWPDVAGLFAATAHYRNGILMAPITAALLTRCIVDGDTPASITPFLPSRFLS